MKLAVEPKVDELFKRVEVDLKKLLDIIVDISIEYGVLLSLFLENATEYEKTKYVEPLLKKVEKEGIEIYAA